MRLKVSNAVLCSVAIHAIVVAAAATLWKPPSLSAGWPCSICVRIEPLEVIVETSGLLPKETAKDELESGKELPPEPIVPAAPTIMAEFPVPMEEPLPSTSIAGAPPANSLPRHVPTIPERIARPTPKLRTGKISTVALAKSGSGVSVGNVPALPPQLTFAATPVYPNSIEARDIGGSVLISFTVDTRGRVAAARVARSSGHPEFDSAALAAVRRYRFSPALVSGRPVEWAFEKRITFRPARR